MGTSIYYFTGTGNSLAIARELAEHLSAELLSMKSVVGEDEINTDSDSIGIVFPVYNHRIPYIVKRFTERLRDIGTKYVFAVCTYGDSLCISLEFLSKLVYTAGGNLSCGFGIKMPYNYINPSKGFLGIFKPFVLRETSAEEQQRMISDSRKKLDMIYNILQSKQQSAIEVEYQGIEHAVDFFNLRETLQKSVWLKVGGYGGKTGLSYLESIQLMDHSFHCLDQCVKCGTCVRICPTENITITSDGLLWKHRCEQCFACLQWCPKQAIQFGGGTAGCKRYHHPDVSLSDMLQRGHFIEKRYSHEYTD